MSHGTEEAVLAVVEGDAACLYWMDHWGLQPETGHSMLEREEVETEAAFEERLSKTLDRLAPDEDRLDVFLLVVSGRWDPNAVQARRRLATRLLSHLVQLDRGRLVLTPGYGQSEAAGQALDSFTQDLAEQWQDAGIEVTAHLAPASIPTRKASGAYAGDLADSAVAAE